MDGRREQGERSMVAILEAARQEFASKGFAGARVDEIARTAGVNKAAIYYHFGDKEVLYKRVLLDVIGELADRIRDQVIKLDSFEERLKRMVEILAQCVDTYEHFAPVMLREIASGGATMPIEVMQKIGQVFLLVKSTLEEGAKGGEFRQVSPFVIHMLIVGGMLFFISTESVRKRMKHMGIEPEDLLLDQSAQAVADQVVDIILNGISNVQT